MASNNHTVRKLVIRSSNSTTKQCVSDKDQGNYKSSKGSTLCPHSLFSLNPVALTEARLIELLKLHRVPLKATETKQELVQLFKMHVLPKPQRIKAGHYNDFDSSSMQTSDGSAPAVPSRKRPPSSDQPSTQFKKTNGHALNEEFTSRSKDEAIMNNQVLTSSSCAPIKRSPPKMNDLEDSQPSKKKFEPIAIKWP